MEIILMQEQEVATAWGVFQLTYELLMSHFEQDEGDGFFSASEFSSIKRNIAW